MTDPISDTQKTEATQSGWTVEDGGEAMTKSFVFANFVEAFGFMARAAIWAEKLNHHPEWSNVYKTVDVRLTTHDTGGLSALDAELAAKMDQLAAG
ncbi:4a-hydroxytetrahydrobiopterin dehydratase [Roseisalinus antarcticus]|uniref:Putative pterin-4-alpha-carbinolamine dehydratase n=1 Tax=Roseisalinus antarcticus TaxID=254357 RepID=A0A1Y5T8G0_9RHOB|nr:4a-hydroxytetrahydrobiopterin dehydratase [Roseisalinus antarcticus]SLN58043.1 Putative pterin-4-alpha-carbinolamine dehydratase [Roseisalinus antarcticus]